jgi:hypothetical protein
MERPVLEVIDVNVGANVVPHEQFLRARNPRDFKPMPFNNPQQLPTTFQDARVAWRQSLRVKAQNLTLIEDNGIEPDVRVLPSELDLIPNTNQNSQLDRIADVLNRKAFTSGRKFMYFQATPSLEAQIAIGSAVEFQLDVQGLRRIQVLDSSNKEVASVQIPITSLLSRQQRSIRFDPKISNPRAERYELKAFDALGNQILTSYRFITFVVGPDRFLSVPATPLTLQTNATYAAIIDQTPSQGWRAEGSRLTIPNQYATSIDTSASFFFKASAKPVTVAINGKYATESGYDFLTVSYKDTAETKVLSRVSGNGTFPTPFTFTPKGDFSLSLQFTSDVEVSGEGITIESITVSA